jgi:hypothetical protein
VLRLVATIKMAGTLFADDAGASCIRVEWLTRINRCQQGDPAVCARAFPIRAKPIADLDGLELRVSVPRLPVSRNRAHDVSPTSGQELRDPCISDQTSSLPDIPRLAVPSTPSDE